MQGRKAGRITTLGFDADDTLWQNETHFRAAEEQFADLLSDHMDRAALMERFQRTKARNLGLYGYGAKGFALSMLETALEESAAEGSGGSVPASVLRRLIGAGQDLLRYPVELLPGVQETVETLAATHRLVLITKGDLLDQERKLAASGLGGLFAAVEIVSDKTAETYIRAFSRHGDGAGRGLMVGNSLRSDILPAIKAGAHGVHVPHGLTWSHEHADEPGAEPRFHRLDSLAALPGLLERLDPEA